MLPRNVQILFPVNVTGPFDYQVPPGMKIDLGEIVYAPIGQQQKLGVVWGFAAPDTGRELKEVAQVKSTRPFSREMLEFVNWVARYNCASPGMVLRMVLSQYKALDPPKMAAYYHPGSLGSMKMTPARSRVLEQGVPFPARASDIAERAGVSPGVINAMASAGGLIRSEKPVDLPFDQPDISRSGKLLTNSQLDAATKLISQISEGGFNVNLLDGVTGSGKTEVYLEAVAKGLSQGKQVLVLVPEIALTQAALTRFTERFGAVPAAWHSGLGDAAKRRTWREVAQGRAKLVIGARSALFLPFSNLGLIIVDEEHDGSYKQEEGVIYSARDMSVVRGKIEDCAVVLASATPSLESLTNARTGRYQHVILPERPGAITLPEVDLIDLKEFPPERGDFLSQPMVESVGAVVSRGEQALLYLNRRGYAPLIICRACGEKLRSPDTDSWLVEHRASGRAVCHQTGFSMRMPKICPSCQAEDKLKPVGPGVERVAEEAARHFPEANIEIMSSDTSKNPSHIHGLMRRMAEGKIDILVGTQMVVKGHNFPLLTFVGVVDGDLSLVGGDPRAGERTYQTLVQVAGRAGRADLSGRALIQTHQPEHEALAALAAGDRERFISAELSMRELLGLPPFGRMAAVIFSGPDEGKLDKYANLFVGAAPRADKIEIFGPSEPPIGRLRGNYRRRLLVVSETSADLPGYMRRWRDKAAKDRKIKLQIDIDPQSFM